MFISFLWTNIFTTKKANYNLFRVEYIRRTPINLSILHSTQNYHVPFSPATAITFKWTQKCASLLFTENGS